MKPVNFEEQPLKGVKVVELASWLMAPVASAILADCGAEVIKIENLAGDPMRGVTASGAFPFAEINYGLELGNRGKKSIAIDIKTQKGREILYKLVETADVFITNLRYPALQRAKVDYQSLSKVNPRLVYAWGSGYGQEGPNRDQAAFDELAFWARGGFMGVLGQPEGCPVPLHGAMGDLATGAIFVGAIMMALFHRERTGVGQEVTTSLYNCGIWINGFDIQIGLVTGQDVHQSSRLNPGNPLYNIYQAKDGKWLQFVFLESDRYWSTFCHAIGREELISEFDSHEKRCQNSAKLVSIFDEVFASKTRKAWEQTFSQYDLPWAVAASVSDVIDDPQAKDNNYFVEIEHPTGKRMRIINTPYKFSKTPVGVRGAAPVLGQHTEEVLLEIGYTWEEMVELKEKGVII